MIIYDVSVQQFINTVNNYPKELISEIKYNLKTKFGILVSHSEQNSWINSLPQIAKLLSMHTSTLDKRRILIEFNIPTSRRRIDVLILGEKNDYPSAFIIELKQWSKVTEVEWNVFRVGKYTSSHPSFQAADYKFRLNYIMGLDKQINIIAGAYLHNLSKNAGSALISRRYEKSLIEAPIYYQDSKVILANDIANHTGENFDLDAITYFRNMTWSPTKHFQEIIAEEFEEINLVGTQKLIYEKISEFIRSKEKSDKLLFLISGDPGCGKTIVAFKLLMLFVKTFSSKTQLIIPGQELRNAIQDKLKDKSLVNFITGAQVNSDWAIIDEAHKAIGRDTGIINYQRILDKLNFAVIFIDDDQVINKKGITKNKIKELAKIRGHTIHEYTIDENFRNRGETNLLDWIDYVFYQRKLKHDKEDDFPTYTQYKYINKHLSYKVYGYKNAVDFADTYFTYRTKEKSTRITSLWHQEFYIGEATNDGEVPRTIKIGQKYFCWNPNAEWWNKLEYRHKVTYNSTLKKYANIRRSFLTGKHDLAPKDYYLAYFNHIQGYEFNNIFVYIPDIFTFGNGNIYFHRERLAKEVKNSQTWSPNTKSPNLNGENPYTLNKIYFLNRIKVMLTRGTKTTHIFAEDKNLNEYILNHIE